MTPMGIDFLPGQAAEILEQLRCGLPITGIKTQADVLLLAGIALATVTAAEHDPEDEAAIEALPREQAEARYDDRRRRAAFFAGLAYFTARQHFYPHTGPPPFPPDPDAENGPAD